MKISVEFIDELNETEVVIKCSKVDYQIEMLIEAIKERSPIIFSKGETDYFIDINQILFFETESNKIYAHTKNDSYTTKEKLYQLENKLTTSFLRVSKSTIINTSKIYSITKNLTSSSLVEFFGTHKKVYVSRKYYPLLRKKLESKEQK